MLNPLLSWLDNVPLKLNRRAKRHMRRSLSAPVAALVATADTLESRTLLSAIAWDGGGGDMNWNNSNNWSGDILPGAGDDVTIDVVGTTAVIGFGESVTQINSLICAETLAISSGVLQIDHDSSVQNLRLSGGELAGSGDVVVAGQFEWQGGNLSGTGSLTAGGGMEISNSYYLVLNGRTLNNTSAAYWHSGAIFTLNGGAINNLAGATFDVELDVDLHNVGGAWATFRNAGTFRKTGSGDTGWQDYGAGTTIEAVFENSGTVEVLTGSLQLVDLGAAMGVVTTGQFHGAADTLLALSQGDLSSTSDIQGDGVSLALVSTAGAYAANRTFVENDTHFTGTVADGGALTIDFGKADFSPSTPGAPVVLSSLTVGGELAGTADVIVAGQFEWLSGTLSGTGSLTAGGGMEISNSYYLVLNGRTLNNTSAAYWHSGAIFTLNGGAINNLAGATFDVELDVDLHNVGGAWATFRNAGTFRKTGSGDTGWQDYGAGTTIEAVFENSGTVEVLTGSLQLVDLGAAMGVVTTGQFHGAADTLLALSQGDLSSTSDIQGDGVSLALVSTAGAYAANRTFVENDTHFTGTVADGGALTIDFGKADFSPSTPGAPVVLSSLTVGGELAGTADVIVAGQFEWLSGTLSGTGSLTAGGGMEISNSYYLVLNGRTLNNTSAAYWHSGAIFTLNGGAINNLAGATFDVELDVDLHNVGGAWATFRNAGTFRKTGSGDTGWQDYGAGTTIEAVFENSGTVEAQVGMIAFPNGFTQTAGATILAGGEVSAGSYLDIQGGSLTGNGTVYASIANGGQVRPGSSAGVIDILGNYAQTLAGAYAVELGTQSDRLNVVGAVSLAGALELSVIGEFHPALDQTFVIVNNDGADAVSGTFNGLSEGQLVTSGGWQFEISYHGGDGNDVTLRSINQPPVAYAGGPYTVVRGGTVQLDASASSDPNQSTASLTYAWDFDGDNEFDDATGIAPVFSAEGIATTGARTVKVQVTDAGGLTSVATATVNIVAVALLPDTCQPGKMALFVGGTLGNDTIAFSPAVNSGDVTVKLNGVTMGTYHPTGRLVAYGQNGNDDIQVLGGINLSAWLYGDGGDDRLNAGNANPGGNLLFGGDGNDELLGGSGRDVMIGGQGADKLTGNANDDILIAGLTTFDSRTVPGHDDFWCHVMQKWTDINVEFLDRVYALRTGNGANLLASVMDDNTADQIDMLQGSSGNDWFIFKAGEDKVAGQTEFVN